MIKESKIIEKHNMPNKSLWVLCQHTNYYNKVYWNRILIKLKDKIDINTTLGFISAKVKKWKL